MTLNKPQIKVPQPILVLQNSDTQRRRLVWRMVLLTLIAMLLVALGYGLANRQQVLSYVNGEETLRGQVKQLQRELEEARHELVLHETAVEVSQQAQNSIRQELKAYHTQMAELEETVEFYKSIMSPESTGKGLRADSVILLPAGPPQEYNMVLTLGQFGGEHTTVQGNVAVSVKGEQGGETRVLEQSLVLDEGASTRFSFRYYQELKGRLVLPEDFEPQQLQVQVIPDSRQLKNTEHSFDWLVKES